ncbi:MAG TPA: S-layer homology domain-containing protein [Thermoanaerobaculia bacterium]|jgi:hypothetical protein
MPRSRRIPHSALLSSVLVLLTAARALGHPRGDEASPKTYGTQDLTYYRVGATEFAPDGPFDWSVEYKIHQKLVYPVFLSAGGFLAHPHLPEGAVLTYCELDFCDEQPGDDVLLQVLDCDYKGHCADTELATILTAGFPSGCGSKFTTLSPGYRVDNFTKELLLQVIVPGGASAGVAGVILGYKLEVSPAPATATFADVPKTHLYFRAIEALADAGITQGCGGGNFCPNQAVTRGELAKFLANALGLHWH